MVATTLLKAALPSIPVVNSLPGIRKTGADPASLHETRSATVTREKVRAYAEVCGFPARDTSPLTYPHVLAFPLHLAVMTSPRFPFPAIGTVHVANSITQHRPIAVGETLRLVVHASELRPHPRGRVVDLLASADVDGETVWESTSTYLRRGRSSGEPSSGEPSSVEPSSVEPVKAAHVDGESPAGAPTHVVPGRLTWTLGGDLGRRYAAVSGDHNPIHLYRLTAKAFGFPRQIAHGMWSLAACVAALENRLPDTVTVDAAFKKPVLLPGTVAFGQDAVEDGIAFALTSPQTGAPHLVGRTRGSAG
jgi:acyl dehydratase